MGRNDNSGNFLQVVANNFDVLALPLVTLVYPLYASIRAIETKSRTDDQQWLTYWVLYSLMTIFELTFAKILEWYYRMLFITNSGLILNV
ncbi:hypothetical protein DVH24_040718 [Malus domestica]|uniref:HVA22-like protein n=1 Tax=Malus domestica TaxID=3750 RepID=A0A498IDC8_MALDO|nr:hypothetical protein DVH24_040718 [Malus domestica]